MNINIEIYRTDYDNNSFDIYISEGCSGADYKDVTLEEIGEYVNDYIASGEEYVDLNYNQ